MSLDQNLFTLSIAPNKEGDAVDLTDLSTGTIHYRKRKRVTENGAYIWDLYDPFTESLLATASGENPTSKRKTIELHNPSATVEMSFTGTISFKWSFDWETHTLEWKKDSCYILRKPDPPVIIAVTKDTGPQSKQIQMLDYNMNRFDINDRKGLEIVLLVTFLTFGDLTEEYRAQSRAHNTGQGQSTGEGPRVLVGGAPPPPPPPPKPLKSGMEIVAGVQRRERTELNEVLVAEEGEVHDYAQYCAHILKDEALLFIVIRAKSAEHVQKVVAVAEETKRTRYKQGEDELHQYVLYDEVKKKKGPKIIKLDDKPEPPKPYSPPTTLTIHLSKIPMPELMPRSPANKAPQAPNALLAPRPGIPPHSSSGSSGPDTSKPGKKLKGKEKKREEPSPSLYPPGSSTAGPSGHQPIHQKKSFTNEARTPEPRMPGMFPSPTQPTAGYNNFPPLTVPPGAEPPPPPGGRNQNSMNPFARPNRVSMAPTTGTLNAPPSGPSPSSTGPSFPTPSPSSSRPNGGINDHSPPPPPPGQGAPPQGGLATGISTGITQLGFTLLDRLTKR